MREWNMDDIWEAAGTTVVGFLGILAGLGVLVLIFLIFFFLIWILKFWSLLLIPMVPVSYFVGKQLLP